MSKSPRLKAGGFRVAGLVVPLWLSYLRYASFGISVENSVEGAEFINAKPVHFPRRERSWANDFGNSSAHDSQRSRGHGRHCQRVRVPYPVCYGQRLLGSF